MGDEVDSKGALIGRDEKGRFVSGNKASPGRPTRKVETDYMAILEDEVTAQVWRGIVRRAIGDALRGNHAARVWVADRLMGKPAQILELNGQEANALAELVERFKVLGIQPKEVFLALIAELGNEDNHERE